MSDIFRFKFFTIGSKNYRRRSSQSEVDALRGRAFNDLHRYQAELRGNWALKPGDSIVRNFHVLDERHCVIEQEIVISIFDVGKTWMAIACSDAGNDLSQGPRFPWLEAGEDSLPITLLPIVQYRPRCALKYRGINESTRSPKGKNTQSLAIFPEGYGRGLDWSLAKSDRLHILADVFRLSAFSQKQLLNVMKEKIRTETNRLSLSNENPTLANLLYFRDILQDQLSNTSYMLQLTNDKNNILQNGHRSTTAISIDQRSVANDAMAEVCSLFQDLHLEAQSLYEKCTQGMTVISNEGMLAESQRAIQQAKLVTKLTIVAFVYLPFTFTAGFFGMNFKELGNDMPLWIFFAASFPLMFVTMGELIGGSLLAVGGVGTTPPEHWTNSKGDLWLGTLDAPDIGILSFPNRLATNGILSGRNIEEEGASLLAELYRLAEDETVIQCPIILIAHSLGGLIVKRAICQAKQSPNTYRHLIRKIAGFVFMGCPHSSSQELKDWVGVESILQKFTKGRYNPLDLQCVQSLAGDCENFRVILAEDEKQLLTVSEKKGMSKQMIGKKILFVDRHSATIGHDQETIIEHDSNHRDLCIVSAGSKTLDGIFDFLHLALDDTRKALAKDSPRYTGPSVFAESTVRDQSSDDEDLSGVTTESMSALEGQNVLRGPDASVLATSEPASSTNLGSWTKGATAGSDKINPDLISALKDFSIEYRDPILPCKSILLPRDPVFSGREDTLSSIRQALVASIQEPENGSDSSLGEIIPSLNVYSLCGPGGMGKTSIANEFVHRYEKDFDAVFWVAADEESKLFNGFRDIAVKLGIISDTDGKDLPAIREMLLAWLANPLRSYEHMDHVKPERASWLIVFDNVDRADTLEDFWPKDAAGSVLVTCRDPLIKSSIYLRNTGSIVPELLEEEGITLLLRLTNRESDEDDVKQAPRVVRALGRYPLAIAQMSGVILARDLGFNEFLELYSEETERREILGISEGQSASLRRYNQTLGTVWNLDDLREGRALLEVISFLDPDSIPESLLEKNPACMDWDRYPKTSLEYSKARAELLSRSLIYRNRGKKTLRVHRLIQDTVRTQMNDATFNEVYSRVLDMLGARWPRVFKGFGNVQTDWQQNSELWAHVLSLFKYRDRFSPGAAHFATAIKRMHFALDVLIFSVSDSRFSASPTILLFFSFLRDAVSGEPSHELQMIDANFHYCRGELGLHINNREHPLPDFSQCVKQLDTLLDDDAKKADSLFGVAVNELGCAYLMNWKNDEGLIEFERAVTILQNLCHPSAQEITMGQINVGFVYGYLGRYDEALQIFEVALKERHIKLGRDDYSSFVNGKLYMGWGNVLAAQGRLDDSFKLHVKCLEHYKRSVGNSHHRTGDGCVKASDHFARTGDGPTALALLDQALKIFNLDTYHRPEAARAHYKKGSVLKQMDQEEEANKEMDTALDIFNSFVSPEDRAGTIDELDDEDFDHWIMFWSR
ncbi:uncharacterized protein N7500_004990 [Penicillium coprophilum]|uniref:uncharacterized protein n=1 Tax=Penicillium coprophilum TaxID=36646 RepID=UPI0023A662AE|nr:uncharacterized protein N7500_004990 [Penicillium coprophilum]KAJ5163160.1 hypothetical protein N7500_004990 [Penicillium coprophilum]